jgi:hypothetical protein
VEGWSDSDLTHLRGLTAAELGRSLAVVPTSLADRPGLAPMAGSFEFDGEAVCFVPRFPFVVATSYSVAHGGRVWTLARPARPGLSTTEVVSIHPSAGDVPLNLLKIYVQFSAPMSEGEAAGAVNVRRADTGEVLDGTFLPMDPELWDRHRRRLTLLLDPGRIKRGLAPHEEAGYPLAEGIPVVVEVDAGFRDAFGRPLVAGAQRRYQVGAALRSPVDPAQWCCEAPSAGSNGPLTIRFDRPLDRALLEHCLVVSGVDGECSVGPGERSWQFVPSRPWRPGRHTVTVDPRLEDLAGNSLVRVFDRDLTEPEHVSAVAVEFVC